MLKITITAKEITEHSSNDIKNAFTAINNEAFPENERCPLDKFFEFKNLGLDVDILGFFPSEESEDLLGFFITMKNETCAYAWFFAIREDLRNKGLGSEALKLIFERYKDYQMVLDFEAIDETAENNDQRIRRKNFYLRNGWYKTGYFQYYCQTEFEIVCSQPMLDTNSYDKLKLSYEKLVEVIFKVVPMFHPKLYRKDNP